MHKWEYTPTYRGFDTFYGYYGIKEDYFTHIFGSGHLTGLDWRWNKQPIWDENGVYSTYLFTEAIQDAIISHSRDEQPFFIYGAYQAVHEPLEVPDQYLEKCDFIPYADRKTFCGMMQALDEGIGNVTGTLEAEGLLNNTVIILSTDNGGQAMLGSSNWPLRGNKATVFEGGVRGAGFVWGKMLSKTNYDYTGLMHITDWYRTIVEGIAGIQLSEDVTERLDGYDMWQTLTQNQASPRSEILLQLNPVRQANPEHHYTYFAGQAALRSGDWKLVLGDPGCNPGLNQPCPTGWVHLDETIEEPADNPSLIWLFNMTADPNERNNVADCHPDIVSQLQERIEEFNSTHIFQMNPAVDIKSNPANFGGVWTPWLY